MNLARACSLLRMPDPIPQEAADVLLDAALSFILSGGALSLSDWEEASADERRAFLRAGRILAADRARQLALALSGPDGLAALASEVDGGASAAQLLCDRAAVRAAESLSGREVRR